MPNKKFWDNSNLQQDIKWDNQTLPGMSDEELFGTNWNRVTAINDMHKGLNKALKDPNWRKNRAAQQRANNPDLSLKISKSNKQYHADNPMPEERKKRIGDTMRGKTLEEIIGEERAAVGRKSRSEFHRGKKRPKEIGQKIAATRRANGSYENSGMTDHVHKESTKAIMAAKAAVRQEIKRKLGLGKADKVPRDLLEQEYKKRGL